VVYNESNTIAGFIPLLLPIMLSSYIAIRWSRIGNLFRNITFVVGSLFACIMVLLYIADSFVVSDRGLSHTLLGILLQFECSLISLSMVIVSNGLISLQTRNNALEMNK